MRHGRHAARTEHSVWPDLAAVLVLIAWSSLGWAQESTPRLASELSAYESVEALLNDTHFVRITLSDIDRLTAGGAAVVVLYETDPGPRKPNFHIVYMWKVLQPEFPDIRFLALRYEGHARDPEYVRRGFKEVPTYALYANGQQVYVQGKGPSIDELPQAIEISRRNLRKLNDIAHPR